MFILKKKIIDNFSISDQHLEQIHLDLTQGNLNSFREAIQVPLRPSLSNFVITEYPDLKEEITDILVDVFLKFKKQFCKKEFPKNITAVKEQIISLTHAECALALPSKENQQKNLNLSRKEFKRLLLLLQQGNEELIERVYLTRFKKCINYLLYSCGSNYDDAYSSTIEALMEIRKDLVQGKIFYGNLDYYFTKRAKSKWYKMHLKKNPVQQAGSLEGLDFEEEEKIESEIYTRELKVLVGNALQKLCGDCKKIIRQYYYEELSLKDIANSMDKSHEAVRKQATRCRDKLRNHLGERFYQQFSSLLNK